MKLKNIKFSNFKNYEKLSVSFDSRIICFTGKNGVGKTNILDAIVYLCQGKSYFQVNDKNVLRKEADFFRIEGRFSDEQKSEFVEVKYKRNQPKVIQIEGKEIDRLSDLVGKYPLVLVAPDDVIKLLAASSERRKLMDFSISQYDKKYFHDLLEYNKLLKQRNALLKSESRPERIDRQLLQVLTTQMSPLSDSIHKARREFFQLYFPRLFHAYEKISRGLEAIEGVYKSHLDNSSLTRLHADNMDRDLILQRTTKGIHKDDFQLYINNNPIKGFASQGQKKSFLLALKTAQYQLLHQKTQKKPLLLLDDFFEKLDKDRLKSLIQLILEMEFDQIFITDTDPYRIQELLKNIVTDYRIFEIQDLYLTKWNEQQ